MTSIVKNELLFNSSCQGMAKSNLFSAYKYVIDALPISLSRYLPEPASASFELKDKCFNLIVKAPLLSLRAILLCVPIANRITQLTLRYLSPKDPSDFINLCPFPPKKSELNVRYPIFIEESFKDKIKRKETIKSRDLKPSHKTGVLLDKMGITTEDYRNTLLNFLAKSPKIKCSDSLKNAVALYVKNNQG
ncbi:MAG: hypothetical protein ACRDAI_08320 [Candidatus Rhabdochlamydia sp.]